MVRRARQLQPEPIDFEPALALAYLCNELLHAAALYTPKHIITVPLLEAAGTLLQRAFYAQAPSNQQQVVRVSSFSCPFACC